MRLFMLRGTVVRVHPLFALVALTYLLSGQGTLLLAYLLTLLVHEAGHYIAARHLHLPVSQLELTPFGGAMQIDLAAGLAPGHSFLLAASGIAVNLFMLLLCAPLLYFHPFSAFTVYLALANLFMLLLNLLPFLPLDGGRMLLALLSIKWERAPAFRMLILLGRVVAVSFIGYSAALALRSGHFHAASLFLGFYLLYASALEERHSTSRYLAALISRRVRVDHGCVLSVQHICAVADMPLYSLLPQLQPGAYHMVEIIDSESSKIHGTLSEDDLLRAVISTPFISLGELLSAK